MAQKTSFFERHSEKCSSLATTYICLFWFDGFIFCKGTNYLVCKNCVYLFWQKVHQSRLKHSVEDQKLQNYNARWRSSKLSWFSFFFSQDAVEYSKSFVTSVILGKDVVPRIGLHQLEALRHDLIYAIHKSSDPKVSTIITWPKYGFGKMQMKWLLTKSIF